jgi:hypothetical protein
VLAELGERVGQLLRWRRFVRDEEARLRRLDDARGLSLSPLEALVAHGTGGQSADLAAFLPGPDLANLRMASKPLYRTLQSSYMAGVYGHVLGQFSASGAFPNHPTQVLQALHFIRFVNHR